MNQARNNPFKHSFTHIPVMWLWVLLLAGSMTPSHIALQAADRQVDVYSQVQAIDSAFRTVFDPTVSPGKGTGWKPYNRFMWFYGQRNTPGVEVNPIQQRMDAWEFKQASRQPHSPLDENWTSIGPVNYSGRIISIAWHPTDTNIIYVGSASGGLWKTTNGGTSWTPMTDDLASLAIGAIALDPSNPQIVYIGTGEGSFNVDAVYGAGVFKSTDGGATWNTTGLSWTQSQNRAINSLIIDPTNTQIIYAACNSSVGGIFKSTNGGTSWTQYHSGDVKDLEMHPDSTNVLYCANGYPWGTAGNGIYKSTNSGVSWTLLSSGLPSATTHGRIELSISPSSPTTVYAGYSQTISAGAGLLGIYRTTNGGATWTQQATTPNMYSGQGWYNLVCQVHPTDANQVWSSGLDAYRSTDGGVNWTRMTIWTYPEGNGQYAHADHHALAYKPGDPNTILIGTDGGLFKSTNGGTSWVSLNNGLITYQYYAMCNDALQPNVAFGGTQDNGTNKYNNSTTHTRVLGGDGGYCNVDFTNSNNVYATTQRGSHYKSTNGGSSFASIQSGIVGTGAWVTPRVMDPTNASVLYTGTDVVYKTTNGGASWTAISTALDASMISHLAVAPSDPQTIYVCYEGYDGKVFKTNNGGTNWTNIETGIPERYPTHVAVDPGNRDIVYCAVSGYGSGHVYKSTNGGSSWSNSSTGLPDLPVNCIVIDQSNPSKLYAGNDLGVYYSSDAGASWSDYSTGLPNVVVDFLALHPTSGVLRAGTHGRGMWETATTAPTLTVLSPNGAETWSAGVVHTITWATGGVAGNVLIQINRNYPNGTWDNVVASTANDGSYAWTVAGPATSTARLRISSISQPAIVDSSNANFTIVMPSVSLITPNGGENWTVGSVQTIRWTKTSTIGNCLVRIKRDYPNGSWEYITTTADTFYNWTVSAPTETDCRIYVYQETDVNISDTSAADFTISGPYLTLDHPNESVSMTPGSTYTIDWTRYNFTGICKAEVNYNYPTGPWNLIADSIAVDSLVWPVPATGSTTARVRVMSHQYAAAGDTSNNPFVIQPPFLQVTAPNTAVTWLTGTTQNVTWTHSNIVGGLNVYVNRTYPSGEWELIAINQTGSSFQWVVDGPTSTTARIRVTSINLPTYYDDSNTNFTIGDGAAGITVTAPNGGESWAIGTAQTITWSRNLASGAVTVSVNRNYPSGAWEDITTTNTGNSQGWTVTGPVSANARIRVTLNSNGAITDASNAAFSIVQPSLALTVPNGSESYNTGATIPIAFTRTNATGNVTVQLNRSYPGGSWETLSTTVSGSTLNWAATAPGTSTARIRVTLNSDPSVGDTSAANFTIVQPSITLVTPNGGEAWNIGNAQTIRWTRQAAAGGVRVMLNRDYPSGAWEQLAASVSVDTFSWVVNAPQSNAARVRVYLLSDVNLADTSAGNFVINNPGLTLTAPNGGESWLLNSPNTIRWTRNNAAGNVTVQFMRNYPSGTWEQLANNVAVDTFSWTPTGAANSNVRTRIYLTSQTSVRDSSNANFALVNPTITVTAPNGGENWPIGTAQVIRFTRSFAAGNATIQLNRTNGAGAWETLTTTCAVDTFVWNVTGGATTTALIRVQLTSDPTITDNSNAVFTIPQPSLTVTAPNGGEQVTLGGTTTLRFTRNYASGAATIKLNRSYPAGAWETLTTNCTVDTFVWNASGAASTTARISVELTAGGATSDESNANFTLLQRTLALTSHNVGTYYVGTVSPITLSRTNADGAVNIELNRNYPSANWETVATGVTGNSYNWTVTTPVSSTARLRAVHGTYAWVGDSSDANFAIENANLTLLAPATGAVWAIGSLQNIAWTKSGTASSVRVDFNRTYPNGAWETLSAAETDTIYPWTVSGPVSTTARFRVVATANGSLGDTSDAVQIAQPALTINAPADNGTHNIGFPLTISWSRYLASGNVTVQVNRSYPSVTWETIGTSNADSLVWTVTAPATSSARYRVFLTNQTTIGDTTGNETIYLPSLTLNAPNGAEQLRYGLATTVSWARNGLTGGVRVEFNPSYPSANWTTLATGQTGTSYNWTVLQEPTTTARVRVIFEQVPSYGDSSNANFTVFRPDLSLTGPVGGEQWVTGTTYPINLTRVDHAQAVTIKLNRSYPSGGWETIATNVTGNSVNWTASGAATTNARLRVESSVYSGIGDTMAANFSILNPGVTLQSPDGGNTFAIGRQEVIRFQRVQVSSVDVYLNRNYPSGGWDVLATNVQADSFVWAATGPASTACRVKVQNSANASQSDQSTNNFSISQPTLAITSPTAGDTLAIGVPNAISFTRNAAATGNVRVDVNLNYPSGAWQQIGITVANDIFWTPAGPTSPSVRIRVVHTEIPNLGDTLDVNLPLDFASLILTQPMTSASYEVGDTLRLAWSRTRVGNGANVYLNRTYPTGNWELVAGNVSSDSYNWIITGPRSTNAMLKVLSTRNASLGDSTPIQTILVPSIVLNAPNSGVLGIGNTETISFTRTDFTSAVALDVNYGYPSGAWQTIATGILGNSYNWVVSGNETGFARLRVRSEEYGALDVCDNNLTLSTPSIVISTLNTSELFQNGDAAQIVWTKNAVPGGVNVELNRDYPGGTWEQLATNVTQNTYTWTVNAPGFAHGRVRVSMTGRSEVFDVNDADFGTFLPALQLLTPNGGDTLILGETKTIRWTRNGASGSARVQLNRDWPNGSWETLLVQTSADSFVWTVSGNATETARVRIQMVFDAQVYDLSDENFAILAESVVMNSPHAGDSVAIGDTVVFRWTRVGIDPGVTVYLKRNYPSGQWLVLANAVMADSFVWVAVGDPAPNAHFRVLSSWNTQLADIEGPCPIGTPVLTIMQPAATDTMIVGGTETISWTRGYANGLAKIEVSRDGVSGPWTQIGESTGNSIDWTVTAPVTNAARFRVSLVNKPWVQGAVGFNSSIVMPNLEFTLPEAGDTLVVGRETVIAWNREYVDDPVDVWIDRGTPVTDAEIIREGVAGDSIHWIVTPPISPNSRFILRTASGIYVEEDGDTSFVVADPVLSVLAPSGGESWIVGQQVNIQWTRAAVNDPVRVELNRNYPSGSWELLAASVAGNSLNWTVSGNAATNARVRITSTVQASLSDVSDNPHLIILPTIAFSASMPARVPLGFAQSINWQATNLTGTVSLYLSRDNGATYPEVIASGVATNSYLWTPSGAAASQARVKIQSDALSQVNVASSSFVLAQPALSVTYPQNNEALTLGFPVTVRWSRADHPAAVRLELDRNYPSGSWEILANSVAVDTFVWTPSGSATATARLRAVSTVNGAWSDVGDNNFTLLQANLDLLTPAMSSELIIGSPIWASWHRTGWSGPVSVTLNRAGGATTIINASTAADTLSWMVNGALADSSWLVLRSIQYPNFADSVKLYGPYQPSLEVLAPTANERCIIGETHTIRWTQSHIPQGVLVYLNSGQDYVLLGSSTTDSLAFTPQTNESQNARVLLRSEFRPDVTDTSATFRLVAPSLVLNALTESSLRVGVARTLSWTAHEILGDAVVELSRDGSNGPWEELYRGTAMSFDWSATLPETENGRLRVRSDLESQFGDTLEQTIEIYQPSLSISMTPVEDTLYFGESVELNITGAHISEHIGQQVVVVLDRDGVYESIGETIVPGTINHVLSGETSEHARFRAFIAGDEELTAATEEFILRSPALNWSNVPNGEVFVGDLFNLEWNIEGIESTVEIVRFDQSGETILAQNLADGSWNWNVTAPRGDAQLIVRTPELPQWADTSELFLVRVPELTWATPNESATDTSGQELLLSWSSFDGATPVQLEVTFDGEGWEMVASSFVDTSYLYTLPYQSSNALQFRVTSVEHPNITAVSPVRILVERALVVDAGADDVWYVGEARWIRWSREYAVGEVEVEVSYGDRAEENWLDVATTQLDSFLWVVEGPATEFAALRVKLAGETAVFDTTDAPFSIHLPSVTVIDPNNGGSYDVTTQIRIRWESEGLPAGVHIGLWRGAPVNRLDTLFLAAENDGEEFWTITGPAADSCFVVITSETDTSIHDASDTPFRITGGSAADPHNGALPTELAMGLPYPNPFNATLTVPFDLPNPAQVKIVVFDILGREVAQLVNEQRPAGFLRVAWDAASASSGLYFVRMQASDFSDVRRVQLLK